MVKRSTDVPSPFLCASSLPNAHVTTSSFEEFSSRDATEAAENVGGDPGCVAVRSGPRLRVPPSGQGGQGGHGGGGGDGGSGGDGGLGGDAGGAGRHR